MDRKNLGLTTLCLILIAGVAQAQIPENVTFQPASYGGGGAPGQMPVYWQSAYVPQPVNVNFQGPSGPQGPRLAKVARGAEDAKSVKNEKAAENEENGKTEENGDFGPIESDPPTFGEQWQRQFPATPDVPTVPVLGTPRPMEVVAPIPYLAYHTTWDGRTHVVPYGPAYLYAPEQLPRRTKPWKRLWSSHPSHKQDEKQVWHLSYYDPMPTILESEPDWWKRTLGYPRPIWGPEPAASWIGGLPAATLSKVSMHFYEGSYMDDMAQYEEDLAQYEAERKFRESQHSGHMGHSAAAHGQRCPLHGAHCPHQGPAHDTNVHHNVHHGPQMGPHPHGVQNAPLRVQRARPDRGSRVSIEGGRLDKSSTGTLILETEDLDKAETEETDPFSEGDF